MSHMVVHRPERVDEAVALLAEHGDDAKVLAGGTAFTIFHKLGLLRPGHLVWSGHVAGLSQVEVGDDAVTLGSMVRLRDLEDHPGLREAVPVLARTLKLVANLRVRNVATIGGNLAEGDPSTDPPAILVAMGAEVEITSSRGTRWVPLSEFFLGFLDTVVQADELLTTVRIPRGGWTHASYVKFVSRHAEDRTCLGAAATLDLADDGTVRGGRIAVIGAAPTPTTVTLEEAGFVGAPPDRRRFTDVGHLLAERVEPMSDHRGSAGYKRGVVPHLVEDALNRAADGRQEAIRW